jgi:hypothetical protein
VNSLNGKQEMILSNNNDNYFTFAYNSNSNGSTDPLVFNSNGGTTALSLANAGGETRGAPGAGFLLRDKGLGSGLLTDVISSSANSNLDFINKGICSNVGDQVSCDSLYGCVYSQCGQSGNPSAPESECGSCSGYSGTSPETDASCTGHSVCSGYSGSYPETEASCLNAGTCSGSSNNYPETSSTCTQAGHTWTNSGYTWSNAGYTWNNQWQANASCKINNSEYISGLHNVYLDNGQSNSNKICVYSIITTEDVNTQESTDALDVFRANDADITVSGINLTSSVSFVPAASYNDSNYCSDNNAGNSVGNTAPFKQCISVNTEGDNASGALRSDSAMPLVLENAPLNP